MFNFHFRTPALPNEFNGWAKVGGVLHPDFRVLAAIPSEYATPPTQGARGRPRQ